MASGKAFPLTSTWERDSAKATVSLPGWGTERVTPWTKAKATVMCVVVDVLDEVWMAAPP